MSDQTQRLSLILLFAAALSLRIVVFLTIGYTTDDAFITFRYSENIAAGKGFVYNEGERVLGTTTPLWTLLLALFGKVGVPVLDAAFVLAAIADLFAAQALINLFATDRFGFLAAIVYLLNPEALQWSLSGMETSLSVALILSAFAFASQSRWQPAFLCSAFSVLTRIDGIAVLGAIWLACFIQNRRFPLKETLLALIVILPWILFAWIYFGSPLPNSAAAKLALSGSSRIAAAFSILAQGFLHLHTIGLPFLILAVFGTGYILRGKREFLAVPIWTWGYALSYSLAAGPMHPWYYQPFYAGYLILILAGCVWLLSRYPVLGSAKVFAAAGSITIIIILLLSYLRIRALRDLQAHMNAINKAVGIWVRDNSAPAAVLAAKDIGYIGYYSNRRILDLAGLVSPECIPYRARNDFLGPLERYRPDHFAFSEGQSRNLGLDQPGVLKSYHLVKKISNQFGTYRIYSRN